MSDKFTAEDLRNMLDTNKLTSQELPVFTGAVPKEIRPPNFLKQKVGSGGLDAGIIEKAQRLVENNTVNFKPIAEKFLREIETTLQSINQRNNGLADQDYINLMIHPAMQLKANGGMFHYELVTIISDMFVKFLESLKDLNSDALEVINGFYTALKAIVYAEIKGKGGNDGDELMKELNGALRRYIDKRS